MAVLDDGYLGNLLLKKKNFNIEYTPFMVEEYIKCSRDVKYFCNNYFKIINIDEGLIPFDTYTYQDDMLDSMANNRFTIMATARQTGKSTTTVAYLLWYILFTPDKTVALLANKGETAREILGKVRLAYQNLPKWLQQGISEWNKGSMELENNSRIIAAATSSDAIRGYSINILFIDETAFIDNWDAFFTSVFPTVSSGKTTKIILVSTPNGMNHFYKLWTDAIEGRNTYNPIKVLWQDVPGRDEEWKEITLASMGFDYDKFRQEYEVEFLGSIGTLISGQKLSTLIHQTPIASSEGMDVYENPVEKHSYVIIVDVARGKGLDYSAFSVIDVTKMPYIQVAAYRNNLVTPIEYTEIINAMGLHYNEAMVLIESNDIGAQVCDLLYYDYEYENVLYTENKGRLGKTISSGFTKTAERGIRTTKTVKSTGCTMIKMLIEQEQLLINDHQTISELSTFIRKGNSYEAEMGSHDDLVMGLVLFGWLSSQPFFKEMTDINTIHKLREKTEEQLYEDLLPFGIVNDNNEEDLTDVVVVDTGDGSWLL
ncbi:terminase [archaeon]|nr:terminase [archaeon]|tara:strand:+ start:6807 stop:8429 length:1623 start_codon:yes stop_codon:yes gene_type:complete